MVAAELVDRFGPLPDEVSNLLEWLRSSNFVERRGVERVEAGPKGAVIAFRDNAFANPARLVAFIARQGAAFKLRPDHRLVYRRNWETPADRLNSVRDLTRPLAKIAEG